VTFVETASFIQTSIEVDVLAGGFMLKRIPPSRRPQFPLSFAPFERVQGRTGVEGRDPCSTAVAVGGEDRAADFSMK